MMIKKTGKPEGTLCKFDFLASSCKVAKAIANKMERTVAAGKKCCLGMMLTQGVIPPLNKVGKFVEYKSSKSQNDVRFRFASEIVWYDV